MEVPLDQDVSVLVVLVVVVVVVVVAVEFLLLVYGEWGVGLGRIVVGVR